jgi:hypothetical protein
MRKGFRATRGNCRAAVKFVLGPADGEPSSEVGEESLTSYLIGRWNRLVHQVNNGAVPE